MRLILTQPQLKAFDNAFNRDAVYRALDEAHDGFMKDDIILLPEHIFFTNDAEEYLHEIRNIAAQTGSTVVGGSFHEINDSFRRNTGAVIAADGSILCNYDKLRPYADERNRVEPGERLGQCVIGGRRVLVLICADFWFSDLYGKVKELPELVLVPALSITRKPSPDYSREMWRHLAVSRAYEFGVYVGISDWGEDSLLPVHRCSGVGGFANAASDDVQAFFTAVGQDRLQAITLDFDQLDAFRSDREARGFFRKGNSGQ
ncbi:MAG: carbon-nitrogen hydrolase family protein [Bacteroidia bacterium]|nr:carbon-nitrogen hydrolase family protein [Bacteroidia bacterium]